MDAITWMMLVAALLPIVAAVLAKAGGEGYDNDDPRPWLARQQGWRARANAAQTNLFEGLPFFYAAVLYALYAHADLARLGLLMLAWLLLRVAHLALYIAGRGSLRSLAWTLSLAVNIAILFAAA
ncbi:MAPEG family protein [Candidimonas humi]|jgi:uncharacterized MAPEG superfamily protein|uniref:MAPEG family protein n=1 Tax=Candidimonas humi TaxID=683355 RepID=A0ABV8NVD5_9BURK|nr:MAPEG family protein [Candidimonas humi]MBV6305831.1 MAPEG family protein [Candidimonas humi]